MSFVFFTHYETHDVGRGYCLINKPGGCTVRLYYAMLYRLYLLFLTLQFHRHILSHFGGNHDHEDVVASEVLSALSSQKLIVSRKMGPQQTPNCEM